MKTQRRLGQIQKKLLNWIQSCEYVSIGESTVPPSWVGLDGHTMDEVGPSLNRLLLRGLIIEPKPGFFAMPGWVRPSSQAEIDSFRLRTSMISEKLYREHREKIKNTEPADSD